MKTKFANISQAVLEHLATKLIELSSHAMTWPRWLKRALVIGGDAMLCVLAVWLAFSLRLGEWRLLDWPVVRFTLSVLIVWFPVAFYQGVYNAIFRYTGRGAIIGLASAVAIITLPLIYFYMIRSYPGVPRTIAVLAPLIFLMMMTAARIIGRYILIDLFHSRPYEGEQRRRTLIYGAGSLGQRLASSFAAEKGLQLVGYLDDDPGKRRHRLDGHRVWHASEIGDAIVRTGATHVLLAMSDIGRRRRREIVAELSQFPVEVHPLPPMRALLEGTVTVDDLRPVQVEDLLGRVPVAPDRTLLVKSVQGKRVMVTGAGGSIGSEICRQISELAPRELVLVEANEFALFEIGRELAARVATLPEDRQPILIARLVNVADSGALARLFAELPPDTIYHAAAYKHVPLVEDNILAAVENNLFGTLGVARAAQAAGTQKFILISTDKAVRPPNVMGATKRACELVLQAMNAEGSATVFAIVRFGNVLGSSGSVVPLFRRQIEHGGPVTVTHREVIRYFMTIPEAAQLVIQAGGMAEGGEVFVLDMGEPVRIWDLARTMIQLAGLSVREGGGDGDIAIVETGLRPGEKLYEELLIGDDPLETSHPRIMRAHEQFFPADALVPQLDALRLAIDANDVERCRKVLRELVPTLNAGPALDHALDNCQTPGDRAHAHAPLPSAIRHSR